MHRIIELIFSKNMGLLLFMLICISMYAYSWYLIYYPTTYTNNYIILDNIKLKGKSNCEYYDDNPDTMCFYLIPNSKYKIELPQMVDHYMNEVLTVGIKVSDTRHILYMKYNTTDIMNPVMYVELKRINKHSSLYKLYCNRLKINYCESSL